jgi:hypothetical protein
MEVIATFAHNFGHATAQVTIIRYDPDDAPTALQQRRRRAVQVSL